MSAAEKLAELSVSLRQAEDECRALYDSMTELRIQAQGRNGTDAQREELRTTRKSHREAEARVRDLTLLKNDLEAQAHKERQAAANARQAGVDALKAKTRAHAIQALANERSALVRSSVRLAVLNALAAGGKPSEVEPEQLPAMVRDLFRFQVREVLEEVISESQ